MKRRAIRLFFLAGALLLPSFAATIDGVWLSEIKAGGKKGGKQQTVSFDLKSDGTALTGSVSAGRKKQAAMKIEQGKFENGAFSFATTHRTRKGDARFLWRGTVEGAELKGTRTREGSKRGQEFTAKRR
jgi:hypothetical protein